MPELPEVETIVRALRRRVAGQTVGQVRLVRDDIVRTPMVRLGDVLSGRIIHSVDRRGKRILIAFEGGGILRIHLGMSGQLTLESPDAPCRAHTHLIIGLVGPEGDEGPVEIRFRDPRRFGGVWWLTEVKDADEGLGPEPLSMRPAQLAGLLARTRRPVKAALLDQSLVAGLGNIYADEALFVAGIHPLTPANQLDSEQIRRLNRAIKLTLERAIHKGGSTLRDYVNVNGQSGRFQNLHCVYGREDRPCRKCRASIVRIVLGGRSTHFCPHCQRRA